MRGGGAIQFCVGTLFRFQVFGRLLGTHLVVKSRRWWWLQQKRVHIFTDRTPYSRDQC
jgi:hypothetical protein